MSGVEVKEVEVEAIRQHVGLDAITKYLEK